jgi:hypothetical protein
MTVTTPNFNNQSGHFIKIKDTLESQPVMLQSHMHEDYNL